VVGRLGDRTALPQKPKIHPMGARWVIWPAVHRAYTASLQHPQHSHWHAAYVRGYLAPCHPSMDYDLFKLPIQLGTLGIVQYLYSVGIDAQPRPSLNATMRQRREHCRPSAIAWMARGTSAWPNACVSTRHDPASMASSHRQRRSRAVRRPSESQMHLH
jgi:hypothetical protein